MDVPRFFSRLSFSGPRFRLTLVALLVLLPALALILLSGFDQRDLTAKNTQEEALRVARMASTEYEQLIEGTHQALIYLAEMPEVHHEGSSVCSPFLAGLLKQFPQYTNLGVADTKGNVICSALPLTKPVNLGDRTWFKTALQTDDFSIGEFQIGRISGLASINFGYPMIGANGDVRAVIFAGLGLDWLAQLAAEAQLPDGSTLMLIDSQGNVLTQYPDAPGWIGKNVSDISIVREMLASSEGTSQASVLDGVPRLYAYSRLLGAAAGGEPVLAIGIPVEIAYQEANQILYRNLIGFGVVTLLGIASAWLAGYLFLKRKLNRVVETASRLAGGDFQARTGVLRDASEISQVAYALDEMAGTLEKQEQERQRDDQVLKRLLNELKSLHAVALSGTEAATEDEVIARATQAISETLSPDYFGVALLDEASATLSPHPSFRRRSGVRLLTLKLGEGLVGQVAQSGKPLRTGDLPSFPNHREADPEVRSELCVPLLVDGQVIGVVDCESVHPDAYSEADERLMVTLAGELATAIMKMRLLASEHRRLREAETLRESAAALTSTLNLEQVLETILVQLERVIPYTSTSIILSNGKSLEMSAQRGFHSPNQGKFVLQLDTLTHIREVLEQAHPVIIADTENDPSWITSPDSSYIRCWMGVPLVIKDRVIGLLNVDNESPCSYTEEDTHLALSFATHAAIAIENARLFEAEMKRNRELAALAQVSAALRLAPNRVAMLPIILDQVLDLLQAQAAALVMREPASGDLIIELGRGQWAYLTGERIPSGKGLSNQILLNSQPYANDDIRSERRLLNPEMIGDLKTLLCTPLIAQGQAIGLLYVGGLEAHSDADLRLLTSIGDLTANAIHRAALHEQTEQRLKRLTILRTVDMAITASIDVRLALNILLDETVSTMRLDAADVLLFDPSARRLDWAGGRGFHAPDLAQDRLVLPAMSTVDRKLPPVRAVLERRSIFVPDLSQFNGERGRFLAQEGFVSSFVIPFIAKGQVKGLLEIFHREALKMDREWLDFLESLAGQAAIALDNADLFANLERSNLELSLAYDATIEGWSRALDLRDRETEGHATRVTEMTMNLARAFNFSESDLTQIRRGALLHDIGKMGIPDTILLKPGPLTPEEWTIMRQHPGHAYHLLYPINFLRGALDIPYCHHEKWDGTGYPRSLKGEEIPLAARIFAVVDVWDALRSDRPYRKAWSEEEVWEYLHQQSGKHFDPRVVEAFFKIVV
ncbi:MAG: GAF domain-containing protein [Chloroflexi bacterium]|nr:GAF domain-containing protein [Chloroflexota bacterium]